MLIRLYFFIFFICISSKPVNGTEVTFVTEDVPPLQVVKNKQLINGLCLDIVKAIVAETEHTANYQLLPWPRAYKQAIDIKNTFIFSLIKNKARENKFIWLGKLTTLLSNITTLKSRKDIIINSFDDIQDYNISVSRGDFGEYYLKKAGFKEGKNLYLTVKHSHMWKMLYKGRVDAVFTNDITAKSEIKNAGLNPNLAHSLFDLENVSTDLYLAANLNSDPELIKDFKGAYQKIKLNGKLDEILADWLPKVLLANR